MSNLKSNSVSLLKLMQSPFYFGILSEKTYKQEKCYSINRVDSAFIIELWLSYIEAFNEIIYNNKTESSINDSLLCIFRI